MFEVTQTPQERFWKWVQLPERPDLDCWIWTGAPNSATGYGRFLVNRRRVLAHRYSYELFVGPIPDGLTLDHLCGNTMCVAPHHLEPVPLRVNVLRGGCPPARNARKSHCKRGHPFDETNTYLRPDGFRECKACRAMHMRNHLDRVNS